MYLPVICHVSANKNVPASVLCFVSCFEHRFLIKQEKPQYRSTSYLLRAARVGQKSTKTLRATGAQMILWWLSLGISWHSLKHRTWLTKELEFPLDRWISELFPPKSGDPLASYITTLSFTKGPQSDGTASHLSCVCFGVNINVCLFLFCKIYM